VSNRKFCYHSWSLRLTPCVSSLRLFLSKDSLEVSRQPSVPAHQKRSRTYVCLRWSISGDSSKETALYMLVVRVDILRDLDSDCTCMTNGVLRVKLIGSGLDGTPKYVSASVLFFSYTALHSVHRPGVSPVSIRQVWCSPAGPFAASTNPYVAITMEIDLLYGMGAINVQNCLLTLVFPWD
jgi:hypothetical protein